jgi:hypothetical protein
MSRTPILCISLLALTTSVSAAPKPHTVAFGKWATVTILSDEAQNAPVEIKVRPLFVDGRIKEFTIGVAHEVTDRIFVVQRAYRLNDLLPRGGWVQVDRVSGRISPVALASFAPYGSEVAWFRDLAAYCGRRSGRTATAQPQPWRVRHRYGRACRPG